MPKAAGVAISAAERGSFSARAPTTGRPSSARQPLSARLPASARAAPAPAASTGSRPPPPPGAAAASARKPTAAAEADITRGLATDRSLPSARTAPPAAAGARVVKKTPSQIIAQCKRSGLPHNVDDFQPQIVSFLNLSQYSNHADSVVPVDEPLFKPTPTVIYFTNFEGLETFDEMLSLRNQDNVARRVKVLPPDSSYFEVLPGKGRKSSSSSDKIAPGMEVQYIIRFKPDRQVENYSYDLVVVTEREKFMVPVRAIGASAILDIPDTVDFGTAPVKFESTKTVLVRNIGEKPAKFLLKTSPPFSTSVQDGYLDVGHYTQIDVVFRPERAERYERDLVVFYGDGIEAYVSLLGAAENVNVAFSQSKVSMSDTFIALSTQTVITIHNGSDVPVDFSWRAFPTMEEEVVQKLKLQVQLKREEGEELALLKTMPLEDVALSSDEDADVSLSDTSDEGAYGGRRRAVADGTKKAEEHAAGALSRRYRNIARSIAEDPMLFYDEIFAIEPLSGRIWARSQATITVSFTPKAALNYQCIAFCSVVGQAERLPLLLRGQGIGPKAAFSYDELDVGDVFVESVHQYDVDLINQGDITVNFQLAPNTSPFGSKFKFTPNEGRLEVGGQCTIAVEFCPDLLGDFNEVFHWDLVGSTSSIPLTFKGHSVSPTFHFDLDRISFGVVSFGFLNSKTLTLTNTSEVPMRFALRIPGDGRFAQKEFDVIPPRGMLLPNCSQKVQVDFISVNVKTYDLCLVVDLDGVGQELASIPIQARCAVPMVSLEPQDTIEYNDIFIRYPAHQTLVLNNTSALPAKFQIMPQDEQTRSMAEVEPDQSQGSVPPASAHVITLTMTSSKIGPMQIPICVRILGHNMPHQLVMSANSIGPIVNVEPAVLDWGNVKCLQPVTRQVKVTNNSVIDASVKAFMKQKQSLWSISPKTLQLKPYEQISVALTLTIDEATKMNDVMHIVVTEGKDITVNVKAKGIDTPVTCKEPLDVIDFGTQYTTQTITKEFLIENRGRKARKLCWLTDVPADLMGTKRSREAGEPLHVFTVSPESIVLDGKSAYHFQFNAMCVRPGPMTEVLLCQEFIGNERKGATVFRSEIRGNFVSPLLDLSQTTISFRYLWERSKPIKPMSQLLGIKNISPLDVKFYIKVHPPFHVNTEMLFLRPDESTEARIEFDPAFKVDRVCGVVRQKLTLIYQDHPQRDSVNLVGEVIFPNIVLSTDKLDFGSVLNETTKQLSITMSNPNVLPVSYQWMFVEEQEVATLDNLERVGSTADHHSIESGSLRTPLQLSAHNTHNSGFMHRASLAPTDITSLTPAQVEDGSQTAGPSRQGGLPGGTGTSAAWGMGTGGTGTGGVASQGEVDINQIFDILPIMGTLEPGASQTTTFTYFGLNNQKFEATAVCQADGGPEYEVTLKGQASRLEFRIDKTELDFGDVPFNQVLEREITISNTGKVGYYFSFNLSGVTRPFVLDAIPLTGLINAEDKQKVLIKFRTGIPDEVCEVALLEVAHFEPTRLTVRGRGHFPGVVLSTPGGDNTLQRLPRVDMEDHERRCEEARLRLDELVPPGEAAAEPEVPGSSLGATGTQVERLGASEVEFEVDRRYLCEALLAKEREAVQARREAMAKAGHSTTRTGISSKGGGRQMRELPPITAAFYMCDFGHIVLGQSGRKVISIYNCYNEPVSFTINRKLLYTHGFIVSPEKVKKLPALKSMRLEVTCFRPKDKNEDVQELDWVIPIKGGPSYEVKLVAHFVLPDLVLSSESVDFGRVLVGQVKRITIKLKNVKAVPIEWDYKAPRNKFGKPLLPWETAYTLSPSSGRLQSGELMWVTISFTPNAAKVFNQKLALRIVDNPHKKLISLHGQGEALRVEIHPSSTFALGPVLPGDDHCTQEFSLHNPTDYPIEVYSVDFDTQYLEEEEMLKAYDKYNAYNLAELPVRSPGEGTWKRVAKHAARLRRAREREERKREREQERERLREERRQEALARGEEPPAEEEEEQEEGEEGLEGQEGEEDEEEDDEEGAGAAALEMDPNDYPFRVPDEDRLNVLIVGPPLSGKTSAARALAAKDGRRVLSLDDVVEWALSGPPSLQSEEDVARRDRFLDAIARGDEEHDRLEAEREVACKKMKQQFVRRPVEHYALPWEDVVHLIRRRTALPDCNCGTIFDGVGTKYLSSKGKAAEAILMATHEEKLSVLYISLHQQLGLDGHDALKLGHVASPLRNLEQGNPEADEAFQQLTSLLKPYYAGLQESFQLECSQLQSKLQEVEAEDAALGDMPEPVPAQSESGSPTMDAAAELSPELLELQSRKKAIEQQLLELQNQLAASQAALSRLETACLGAEAEHTAETRRVLAAIERAASSADEKRRSTLILDGERRGSSAEATAEETAAESLARFEPPERQEEAVPQPDDIEEVATPPPDVATLESLISFVPLALDGDTSAGFFERLKAATQAVIPMPLVPEARPLPPPSFVQLVGRPQQRPPRAPPEHFSIITEEPPDPNKAPSPPPQPIPPAQRGSKVGAAHQLVEPPVEEPKDTQPKTRWLIEPHSSCELLLKFFSNEIGTFTGNLGFEVVGGINGNAPTSLNATGVTAFPAISSDPRNVFMRRVKTKPASGYAHKQFILSQGVFDFGPLLVGRDPNSRRLPEAEEGQPPPQLDAHVRQHVEALRITNNSLFRAKVSFDWASVHAQEEHAAAVPEKPAKGKAKAKEEKGVDHHFEHYPFLVEPKVLELEIDETKELQVSCFPVKEGTYSDTLVATVQHNPEPVHFPVAAIGALPKVNLDASEVDFDRLLLKQVATNCVKLANVCAVPVRWQLQSVGKEGVPEPFVIEPMEGTLGISEEKNIEVTFKAVEPAAHKFSLRLQITDTEGLRPMQDAQDVEIRAEAFLVDVLPEFPNGGRGLDFGDVRVGATAEQQFTVANNGKYAVNYELRVRRKAIREILEIEAVRGDDGVAVIQPGQKRIVKVRLSPKSEFQCPEPHRNRKNEELDLQIFEAQTGEQVHLEIPPISLSFRALFNSFSVSPPRGLTFGSVKMGESGVRDFEITNDGIFKFDWNLFEPTRPVSDGGPMARRADKGELTIGPFKIKPAEGVLNPKESARIEVRFTALEDAHYDCKMGIHVEGMPEASEPEHRNTTTGRLGSIDMMEQTHMTAFLPGNTGVVAAKETGFREYLLTAQGCTPGIETESLQTVFEEQFMARSLEDAIAMAGRIDIRAYVEEDRVFSFGPVVVQGPSSESQGSDAAKFRITNPRAIPCDVKFSIKPRGASKDPKDPPAFDLSTDGLHIPPHEYRYVKVRFRPPGLQTYVASFEAAVPEGKDPRTNLLQFELRGDGTVPTVSLDGPPLFGDGGGEFKFGKLQVGRSHSIDFMLRNDGIVPAVARCDCSASPHFHVTCTRSVTLEPKAQYPFKVSFQPTASGELSMTLHLHTLHNPFEDATIKFVGEGYVDEVSWDLQDVPRGAEGAEANAQTAVTPPSPDELKLGEVALGAEAAVTFYVSNTSRHPIRFQFPEVPPAPFASCLQISPSVGHVLPGARKPITFTLRPTERFSEEVNLPASIASIEYEGEAEDWDDSMKTVNFEQKTTSPRAAQSSATPRGGQSSSPRRGGQSSSTYQSYAEEVMEEPAHRIRDGTTRNLPLRVSAVADERTYECTTDKIRFSPTVLFQTRVHRFRMSNPGAVTLPFEWAFKPLDAEARAPGAKAYSIQPAKGVVAASAEQEFTVRFSPVEVEAFECRLECQIPHLASRIQPLQILVDGSALRPWCHFELPPSDYRTRRQSDVPLDPKYQIVEFESLGTRVKNTKRFYVLNPTAESYEFVWKQEENDKKGEQEDPFRCLTKHGTISPGKKFEMVFDYLPMTTTTQESFWTFSILGKDATQWFVLVGSVQEPRVGLDCPSINFGRLLLGAKGRETVRIVNKEHLPFSCSFQRSSFESEGQVPALSLSPMTAVVGPGASLPVEVTFEPAEEKCYNFNVVCTSKRREKPIMLNVKGEGYKIHTKLILEEPGQEDRQLHPGVKEALDFGSLQVQERRGFTLRLSSPTFTRRQSEGMDTTSEEMPNVRYDFIWQVRTSNGSIAQPRPDAPPYLTISPMHGVATQDGETVIRIEYAPPESHSLDGTSLRMLIPSGPGDSSYNLKLAGHARRPLLDFSTTSHDFGPCFVKRGGVAGSLEPQAGFPNNTPFERLDLVVTNRDQMDCWLTTTFQRTSWIDVQLVSSMIEAGGSLTVPIIFTPRDYVEYREQIDFVINDTTMTTVNVRGSGCQLQLEMASMAMQNVDFGVTVGNQPVSRTVKVVNRSKRSLEFFFEDADGQLSEHCVSWSPPRPVALKPKEVATFEVYFAPSFHVAPFRLPIVANCGFGQEVHLFSVSGTCHTAELRLSEHSIIFGDVVFQSTAVRQLRLHNFGDLGVKFRFELPGRAASLFSVEPSEGYAPMHDDVQLQVRFHPTRPGGGPGDRSDPSARPRKLRCHFDPAYQQPLELIVQGQGVEQPEAAVQLIEFATEVRERKTREILFPPEPLGKNPTGEPWRLTPVVATEVPGGVDYWSCPAELVIPPGGQAPLEIAYKPLTMTLREEDRAAAAEAEDVLMQSRKSQRRRELPPEKHVGKVFIPTPDGSAFVFNLEGTALPPKDAKRISAEVQCKTPHIQAVAVSNWLRETQRFSVKLSLVQPPDAGEEIKLHGVEAFDLQPGVTKEYKFNVYAYREGTALARLVLTNQKTEEFLTYEVAFKFVAPDTIGTINLSAACRQMAAHPLSIVNPLSTPASFKCESSHPDVRFKPPTLTVAPGSEGLVEVVFRPVLAGAGQATLRLVSPELGEYPYTLKYDARPAGLEKTIVLKAPLGSTETVQNFTFMHYARKPAVYTWRLEAAPGHNRPSSDFLMEPKEVKVNAATEDGLEVTVDVRFQPSCLGEVRSVLVLSSPDGGEYKALLVGYAQQPQPQGPIVIQSGKAGAVEFYNPFDEAVEFTVQVDNPAFIVGSRTFRLDSKKSSSITVQFKSDRSQGGRLIVTATHKVPTPWIFFLKGAV